LPGHPCLQKTYATFEQRPSAEYNEILPVGWYEQTRTMNPKGSEIEWQKFEIPVETGNKAHAETHVMKATYYNSHVLPKEIKLSYNESTLRYRIF
jgi:hypothetical protein